MKTEQAPPWPLLFGLLVILVVVATIVQKASLQPSTAEGNKNLLEAHEGLIYFIDAEIMAKQLLPDPSLLWSHALLDDNTGCFCLGNGVWYASGLIRGQADHSQVPTKWEVLFLPDERKPLYVRVGNLASGDAKAALLQAKGAPGEK